MKRKLTLIAACVAVLFLCTLAVAGGGGPAANKKGNNVEQNNGPPDETPVNSKKEGGGWGKICKGDECKKDGCMWQEVCAGECLADGCIIENGPIPAGTWQETLLGGVEGAVDNTLYAYGKKVWILEDAKLRNVVSAWGGSPECWLTIYEEGQFTLDLPCGDGPLVDPDVDVYNYTCKSQGSDFMSFTAYFSGAFAESDLCFEAVGHYAGVPILEPVPESSDSNIGGALDAITLVLKKCPVEP